MLHRTATASAGRAGDDVARARASGAADRTKAAYRADIDGLRAVAVLSVLLYHVGVPGFSGGFVGVDVFFVISGYLICGMIDAQLREGTFALGDFYKRRIMRIIPALAVTMLVTTVLAYLYFMPVELNDYAVSLVAAAASVSNMYFAYTAGYFDAPALTKPLLHTWSLGVEEQFYVATPLLMLLVVRYAPQRLRVVLMAATVLSLILAAFASVYSPTKAFYFAPFRAWEFLFGALVAIGAVSIPGSARVRDGMGLLGLAMIVGATHLGSSETPFVVMTGLASLGAVMIIASTPGEGARSAVGRVLALPPLVFVGLVSYSVYLWHWPIFVFLRTAGPDSLPPGVFQVVVIGLSLVAGILSWRFVERPFRSATPRTSKRAAYATFAAASIVLAGIGTVMVKLDGLPSRFSPEVARLASYLAYDPTKAFRQGRCYLVGKRQALDETLCLRMASDRPNYLLVGDSFAAHLWLGLSTTMADVNILQASVGQCRPVMVAASIFDEVPCAKLRSRVLDTFLAETKVDKVMLAAAWKDEDLGALSATLDILRTRGLKVVVFGPLVEYQRPLPRLLADATLRDDPSLPRRMREAAIPARDRTMRALVTAKGAEYVSLYAAACPSGICQERTADGAPFQFDTGHLTGEGSIAIARRMVGDRAFQQVSAR